MQENRPKQQPAAAVVALIVYSKGSSRSSSPSRSSSRYTSPSSSNRSRTKCTSYAALGLTACEGALWHLNQATLCTQKQHSQQLRDSKVQAPADVALSGVCSQYVFLLTCS